MAKDFLVELGTEELPPKALQSLSQAFEQGIVFGLQRRGLHFSDARAYATPRRLAVTVTGLDEVTPTRESVIWGPPANIAFDNAGNPTKAGHAFAQKHGLAATALVSANDGKTDKLVYRQQTGGEPTCRKLAAVVEESLTALPVAKRMRWGAGRIEFVRPVHWLLMLFGDDIVDATLLDLRAERYSYGHRFHYDQAIAIDSAAGYEHILASTAFVIADFDRRRADIKRQVAAGAHAQGGTAVIDDDLLDEVTALVEWPVALGGRFDRRFLTVPAEALVSSMQTHQRYFPIVDEEGALMPHFITVANIESRDPTQIIDGNERVIRPRLADADFFYQTDKATSLVDKRERLKTITFQQQLGSIFDKTERIATLAKHIGACLDRRTINATTNEMQRAGQLCKSDLAGDMVLEFADMQGIAGYYYAKHDGESDAIAVAIKEHYLPRFAGDKLPTTALGGLIALADRIDTLMGIFAIGEQPTGSKDPFALRRASVGVLRLLIERQWDLDLRALLTAAYRQYDFSLAGEQSIEQVLAYILERLRAWYEERQIPAAVFESVSAMQLSAPVDIDRRVTAVHFFQQLPAAQALAAANKRVSNMLAKQATTLPGQVDETLLQEPAERRLAQCLAAQTETVMPLLAAHRYKEVLTSLAESRDIVDDFFNGVMVMTDDQSLRRNRLALLQQLQALFLHVADISYLATKHS